MPPSSSAAAGEPQQLGLWRENAAVGHPAVKANSVGGFKSLPTARGWWTHSAEETRQTSKEALSSRWKAGADITSLKKFKAHPRRKRDCEDDGILANGLATTWNSPTDCCGKDPWTLLGAGPLWECTDTRLQPWMIENPAGHTRELLFHLFQRYFPLGRVKTLARKEQ